MRELRLRLALHEHVGGVCVGGRGVCGWEGCVWVGALCAGDAMLIEWSPSHLSPFFHTQLQSCMADKAINRAEYCLVVFGNVPMSRSKLLEWSSLPIKFSNTLAS